jgi:hypothetical protein
MTPMKTKLYALKLKLAEFQAALRGVFEDHFATLRLRIAEQGNYLTLISSGDWTIGKSFPDPNHEPVFACYLVMSTAPLEALKRATQGQTILNLIVSREQPQRVQVILYVDGRAQSLDRLHILGPGMIRLSPSERDELATKPTKRNSRIQRVQGAASGTWASATLLVVGGGSGGSSVGLQLASQNPASIIVVDPDVVKFHNLVNMPHARPEDAKMKRRKAYVLARAIHANAPRILVQGIAKRIQQPDVLEYLQGREPMAVFSFVDDVAAHLASSLLAQQLLVPHVAIGTLVQLDTESGRVVQQADVRLLEPGKGCLRCVPWMQEAEYKDAIYELHRPAGAMRRGPPRTWRANGRIGSSLALNQMAAGMAVELLARYLRGEVTTSTWIRYFSGRQTAPELLESSVGASSECEYCDPQSH